MKILDKIFRRDKAPLTWKRKLLLALAFALPVAALFAFSNRGLLQRAELETRASQAQKKLEAEQHASDSLRELIGKLKSDTLAIERVAREHYGMVRPGETVYKLGTK